MVEELDPNLFCLTTEATALYLQLLSYQHAERQARNANTKATLALIIALIAVGATLFVRLGWPWK